VFADVVDAKRSSHQIIPIARVSEAIRPSPK
jgi:hypothetical protein